MLLHKVLTASIVLNLYFFVYVSTAAQISYLCHQYPVYFFLLILTGLQNG